jgi:pimeloyl-ACP methyl ester carboxylesterase
MTIEHVPIPYVAVGTGEHHVIALHGWFGSSLGWGSLPDFLNGQWFTYAFMDLRGYGARKQVTGDFTMEEAAADAIALADQLGWERFSVMGHSMSGVAVQYVLLQAPGRVRRLVGVAPVPATGVPFDDEAWALFTGAATSRDNRVAINNFSGGSRLTPTFVDQIVQHSFDNSTPEAFGAYLGSWAKVSLTAQVKGNETPVKVIVGEHDPSMSALVMEQTWLEFYPNSELEVLRGSGHYPMFETPVALATSIEEFLERG